MEQELKGLIRDRDNLDVKIRQLKKEITQNRKKMRGFSKKRRDIINTIKKKNSLANKARGEREKYKEKIQKLKAQREEVQKNIRQLQEEYSQAQEGAPKVNFKKLLKEKEALEWKLQTSVLNIKKEDEIVKRIEELEKELSNFKGIIKISKKLDKERQKDRKLRDKIIKLSNESQVYHEEFISYVDKIKELEKRIDEINEEKRKTGEYLDQLNEEVDRLVAQLKKIDKTIVEKETEVEVLYEEKSERELRKEAKQVYEKFKKGEKLDTDDIYLLRRFNFV